MRGTLTEEVVTVHLDCGRGTHRGGCDRPPGLWEGHSPRRLEGGGLTEEVVAVHPDCGRGTHRGGWRGGLTEEVGGGLTEEVVAVHPDCGRGTHRGGCDRPPGLGEGDSPRRL